MSHNPNTVESQDDLSTTNNGKRSSDVVLSAVEKCERLQKQLDIAKEYLKERADKDKYADWLLLRIEALNEIHKKE